METKYNAPLCVQWKSSVESLFDPPRRRGEPFEPMKPTNITAEYAREAMGYDHETGILTWKHRPANHFPSNGIFKSWNTKYKGLEVGKPGIDGYLRMAFQGKSYLVHRMIWFIEKGIWPEKLLDHINQNKTDNKLTNLREADKCENGQNAKKRSTNKSGLKGVYWNTERKGWNACVTVKGKRHTKIFSKKEDAEQEVKNMRMALHKSFMNHG